MSARGGSARASTRLSGQESTVWFLLRGKNGPFKSVARLHVHTSAMPGPLTPRHKGTVNLLFSHASFLLFHPRNVFDEALVD